MDWREIVMTIGIALWIICFLIFAVMQIKKTGWAWWRHGNPLGEALTPGELKIIGAAGLFFLMGLAFFALATFA